MTGKSDDLKVNFNEISGLCDILDYWEDYDEIFQAYINILDDILDNSVKSGDAHDSISYLEFYAEKIYKNMNGAGTRARKSAQSFMKKIETVDLELYKEG